MKLFLLIIIFFMLNVAISCGENTNKTTANKVTCENIDCGNGNCIIENNLKKCSCDEGYQDNNLKCELIPDLCENISCGEFGNCKVTSGKANCECNIGYHNENLKCLRNVLTKENIISACEKIIPCKTGGEEDIDLCVAKYNSFYHSEEGSIYAYYMPIKESVNDYILCINSRDTCDEYDFCFNDFMGITYSNEDCDNIVQTCSDNKTLKVCENGKFKITNCSVVNKKCLEYGENKAICSNDTICDINTFENYCNDNGSLVYCKNGVTQEYYCPYYGMECRKDNDTPNCYLKDNTNSCEENNKTSCENDNMVLCRDNKELITSCTELFGKDFKCLNFKYKSGDLIKDTYGCFFE